jgi:hypothetical protein
VWRNILNRAEVFWITHTHTSRHTQTHTHVHAQTVGLLWTIDKHVAKAATYTTRNKQYRRTSMPSEGFKPAIPAVKRLQTYALGSTATGIGFFFITSRKPRERVKA